MLESAVLGGKFFPRSNRWLFPFPTAYRRPQREAKHRRLRPLATRCRCGVPESEGGAAADREQHVDAWAPRGCQPPARLGALGLVPGPRREPAADEGLLAPLPAGPAPRDQRNRRAGQLGKYQLTKATGAARRRREAAHAGTYGHARRARAPLPLPRAELLWGALPPAGLGLHAWARGLATRLCASWVPWLWLLLSGEQRETSSRNATQENGTGKGRAGGRGWL